MSIRRSLLFVPGTHPQRFEKASASGADAICIDLEDACLDNEKAAARQAALDYIAESETPDSIILRVNSPRTPHGFEDISAIITRSDLPPMTLMLPKVATATEIQIIDQALQHREITFIALIETAQGIANAISIAAASERLSGLMFGGGDLSAELGTTMDWEPLFYARGQVAIAAASQQLELIDVPYLDVNNDACLKQESLRAKAMGYTAKSAIHPKQVDTINTCFTPLASEIEHARKIVDAYHRSVGGALLVNGSMIDLPLVLAAKRTVAIAETLGL